MSPGLRSLLLDDGSGALRSPLQLGSVEAWFDETDPDSMIYDTANRVALISDKSGKSGTGSGTSTGLHMTGTTGQYGSTPDSAAVSITGDIDLRAYAALNNWASGAVQTLVGKNAAGTNRQYYLSIGATGFPSLTLSLDGSAESGATSTAATGLSARASSWIRATWRQSDGRVQFFTSTDGSTWTQLGTDRSIVIASIFDGTAVVSVGARVNGNSELCSGIIYRAQIYAGLTGTDLRFDANFVGQRTNAATFTESSSNAATVTINGTALLGWVDSGNVLCLSGVSGNYASSPDGAPISITGDIDIRLFASKSTWVPSSIELLVEKSAAGQISYDFRLNTDGTLSLFTSSDGTAQTAGTSSVATGIAAYTPYWVRVTRASATGQIIFYTSPDGSTWTQLGTTRSNTSGAIFDSTTALAIGGASGAGTNAVNGNIYRAQIYNGIAGTLVFDANFATCPKLASSFIESSTNAAVVTINTSGATGARVSGPRDRYQGTAASQQVYLPWSGSNYLICDNASGSYASLPNAAPIQFTGDIEIIARVVSSNWSDLTNKVVVARRQSVGQFSWQLAIGTLGGVRIDVSQDGTNPLTLNGTLAQMPAGMINGQPIWIRATRVASTGVMTVYASAENTISAPTTWTTVSSTTLATGAMFNSTSFMEFGSLVGGTSQVLTSPNGVLRVLVYNGLVANAGTLAADFNPSVYTSGTTFLDSSANAAIITINGRAMIVTRSGLYSDGSDDASKTPSFSLPQPATVVMVVEQVTWTNTDCLWAGNVNGAGVLAQDTSTPGISTYPGTTATAVNSTLPLRTGGVTFGIVSGTSSETQVGRGAATTGGTGTTAMNGFTVAANGNGNTGHGNVFSSEELLYSKNLSSAERSRLALWSARKHRLPAV